MVGYYGRKEIFSDVREITKDNIVQVLEKAVAVHRSNRRQIDYLYNYKNGKQPVLNRKKEIRPEICNKIVVNRANEIVSFKDSYLMGKPVQYVGRTEGEEITKNIKSLNDYMYAAKKASSDKKLATWFHTCGVAYRMVLPDKNDNNKDGSPFVIHVLDPRNTFLIKFSGIGNDVLAGVTYVELADKSILYSVYTPTMYFELIGNAQSFKVTDSKPHALGQIPIIEYVCNESRLGSFEVVLDLLDAINITASNRIDGIEQFIQSLMVLKGVDIEDEQFKSLKELGGIKVPEGGDVKFLVQELNQNQTQTVIDDMYDTILTICGMPNRNGGTSTSDTGTAVIMRDGWGSAEARAQETQVLFEDSEKEFLKIVLRILRDMRGIDLKLKDVDVRFTRGNYENITQKAQVLTTMLNNEKIHPQLAFTHSGMFVDPELAYSMSKTYVEKNATSETPVKTPVEETNNAENN